LCNYEIIIVGHISYSVVNQHWSSGCCPDGDHSIRVVEGITISYRHTIPCTCETYLDVIQKLQGRKSTLLPALLEGEQAQWFSLIFPFADPDLAIFQNPK
jgi:hypothetical protein